MRPVPSHVAVKLAAAAAVIAERGLDDAKIEDLATAAGVPKATLYYYFTGKEEILSFLFKDMLQRLTDDVAVAITSPGTAADRLCGVILAQFTIINERPDICQALAGDFGRVVRMPEVRALVETAYVEPVERLLEEGVRDGSLTRASDTRVTAMAVFGAITMIGMDLVEAKRPWTPDEASASLLELVSGGLAPR